MSDLDPYADALAVVRSLTRPGDDVAEIIVERYETAGHSLRQLVDGMAQLVIVLAASQDNDESAMDVLDGMIERYAATNGEVGLGGTLRQLYRPED